MSAGGTGERIGLALPLIGLTFGAFLGFVLPLAPSVSAACACKNVTVVGRLGSGTLLQALGHESPRTVGAGAHVVLLDFHFGELVRWNILSVVHVVVGYDISDLLPREFYHRCSIFGGVFYCVDYVCEFLWLMDTRF